MFSEDDSSCIDDPDSIYDPIEDLTSELSELSTIDRPTNVNSSDIDDICILSSDKSELSVNNF